MKLQAKHRFSGFLRRSTDRVLSRKLSIVPTLLPLQPEIKRSQAVQPTSEHQTQHKVWTCLKNFGYIVCCVYSFGAKRPAILFKKSLGRSTAPERSALYREIKKVLHPQSCHVCVCVPLFILFMSHSLTSCINSNHQKRYTNGIHQSNMISCNVARRGTSWQVVARRVKSWPLFSTQAKRWFIQDDWRPT